MMIKRGIPMQPISTFSIVARDPLTGELGVAVQSKFLAVGSAVGWAKAGAGAIATQAMANLDFGELGLIILGKGYTATQTMEALKALDPQIEDRQFGIVDHQGNAVTFTGKNCFDYAGGIAQENLACQGNILVSQKTVQALADTFNSTQGSLARRLLTALDAAQEAGGDRRGRQSAALLVVKEGGSYGGFNDQYIDLRVDDDPEPIKKLAHLLSLHEMYFNKPTLDEIVEVDSELAKRIQTALKKIAYYKGEITGIYDEKTVSAYNDFCGWENYEERIIDEKHVDKHVIEALFAKQAR
jgi:uncharacterized Ntn-hydrolase superfamily protein